MNFPNIELKLSHFFFLHMMACQGHCRMYIIKTCELTNVPLNNGILMSLWLIRDGANIECGQYAQRVAEKFNDSHLSG